MIYMLSRKRCDEIPNGIFSIITKLNRCFRSPSRGKWLFRSQNYRLNFFNFLTP